MVSFPFLYARVPAAMLLQVRVELAFQSADPFADGFIDPPDDAFAPPPTGWRRHDTNFQLLVYYDPPATNQVKGEMPIPVLHYWSNGVKTNVSLIPLPLLLLSLSMIQKQISRCWLRMEQKFHSFSHMLRFISLNTALPCGCVFGTFSDRSQ